MSNSGETAILRMAVVTIYGPKGNQTVNALLDEGSTVTLISAKVADELGLDGVLDPLRLKWTDGWFQSDLSSKKVDCWIIPYGENQKFKLKKVRTVQNLALPAQRTDLRDIIKLYPHLQSKKIKVIPGERPLILLGQQHINLTVARDVIEKDEESPMITNTKLGWVLHGPASKGMSEESTLFCHECDDDLLHNLVKESFSLENIGIKATVSTRSKEAEVAEAKMKQMTHRIPDGSRWETGLLWRNEQVKLPPSRDVALSRFLSIERKLRRNPELARQYNEKIQHYLKSGYARKLTKAELKQSWDKEWYLPHFDTMHPNKPRKIRIVFDAASRSRGVSLNDYLLTGPNLLVSLLGLLIKFRLREITISGDIVEMFHQIIIRREDCRAQRFIWRENEDDVEPSVYELVVMLFGSVCSPYCAQYVKNANATEYEKEFPKAVKSILDNHYMDDWLQSVDTVEEAFQLVKDVTEVHRRGGFQISKWASNSSTLMSKICKETTKPITKDLAEWAEVQTQRVLGLHWIPDEDRFTFHVNLDRAGKGIATGEVIPTKRAVLRLVMLVWDPLGFLGHYLVKARILLQDIWKRKIGWDDQITDRQFKKWKAWISNLPKLSGIRLPRCYSPFTSSSPDIQIHIFCDSSEQASCCLGYLRVLEANGQISLSMMMSKTRVAPLKPCSVPRLELTAALMAARMGKFLLSEIDVRIHKVFYWTDSMTTLRWIRSDAARFQQFVAVRVGEIQEVSETSQWRWVPSSENPADDGTRDGRTNLEHDCRWWNGPEFLKPEADHWPTEVAVRERDTTDEDHELKREFVAVITEAPDFCLPDVQRFSSYLRLVRATAKVLQAVRKFRREDSSLPVDEAILLLCQRSQWESYPEEMRMLTNGNDVSRSSPLYTLSPMLDKDKVLRMESRLTTAEEDGLRRPIILHPKDRLTRLLIERYHVMHNHAGEDLIKNEIRQTFWIPRVRNAIRKVVRECFFCRKRRCQARPPVMGALPDIKLQAQPRAFYITGMDYFGPIEVTVGRRKEKRYGVLFTCMNTRAVHLEVAASLTTDSCIMANRRLMARRGEPSQIFSDNGTNLRGAEKELRLALEELDHERITGELVVKGIKWHFIPPAAAHMGGSWERLVRSVKVALTTILKERAPKEEVLQTVFAEAEATVNSRPLTDVPVDPESPEALTPFHFLIGTSSHHAPPGDFGETGISLERQWRQSQSLANLFWKRWLREYLPTLQKRPKWHSKQPGMEIGDIVLVLDESLKRNSWPLGAIINTFPGKDGVVRVVEVKTNTGMYRRPVVKLAKMDIKAAGCQDKD